MSFDLHRGETLGIVGESGCGKSTLAKVLMRLEKPTSGTALYEGRNIFRMNASELRRLRRNVQMVMQDPYTSLNPRMTVGDIIGEPFEIHPDVAPRRSPERPGAGTARRTSGSTPSTSTATRTSSPAASDSASGSPARSRSSPRSSSATSRSRHWTSPSRHRSSTCWSSSGRARAWPTSSSRTTCRWCGTSPTGSPSCTSARSSRSVPRTRSTSGRPTRTPRRCCRPCRCRTRTLGTAGSIIRLDGRRAVTGEPAVRLPLPDPLLEGAGRFAPRRIRR